MGVGKASSLLLVPREGRGRNGGLEADRDWEGLEPTLSGCPRNLGLPWIKVTLHFHHCSRFRGGGRVGWSLLRQGRGLKPLLPAFLRPPEGLPSLAQGLGKAGKEGSG